jgi:hypothetical protein
MSEFLEQLKARMEEAQKRHQLSIMKLQLAQQENGAATQDFASWQNAVRVETLREQQQVGTGSAETVPVNTPTGVAATVTTPVESQPVTNREEVNKTDLIRQMFNRHPEGLRPTEIWKQIGAQLKHRAYLYSVLKRLKDHGEIVERRGKYFAKVMQKIEGEEKGHALVQ